jgi:glutathione synthase/RimK-type ligase-like ATP-grasp enzyme
LAIGKRQFNHLVVFEILDFIMKFTIIGNPENRRVIAYCETVQRLGYQMPQVISYAGWLSNNERPFIPAENIVKIDSPGENDAVRSILVERGGGPSSQSNEFGRINNMRHWHAGYCNWLQEMQTCISEQGLVNVMNDPAAIQLQFNKPQCQALLQNNNVPVPFRLAGFSHYDELVALMNIHGLHKVFIKPAHASSASGVVAFRKSGHRVQAVTSAEMVENANGLQLYNSLNVRTYTSEKEIAALINHLVPEQVFAEEWLPKATLHGRFFDVRVLVIAGKARHTVIRTSNNVITNLHLGNRRGDMNEFITHIGADKLHETKQLAEQAAACFPKSLYMGIDILLTAGLRKTVVLEINAFGDLLPGLLDNGETCYEAQINAMVKKTGLHTLC